MRIRYSVMTILLTSLFATASFAQDAAGTWRWTHQDAETQALVKNTLKFKLVKGKLSGMYYLGEAPFPVKDPTLNGQKLSWNYDLTIDGNVINVSFVGAITRNNIKGTVKIGDFGEFPWTAKRTVTDPVGTWRWDHEDPGTQATVKDTLKLKMVKGKLSGTYYLGEAPFPVKDPKLDGQKLSWNYDLKIDDATINISFVGEINEHEIKGTVKIGDFGEFPWTAQRDVAATDPAGTWRWEHQDDATQKTVKDTLKLKFEKGKVSGTYLLGDAPYPVKNGKIVGNKLSWAFDLEIDGNTVKISFVGEISGNDVNGSVTLGDLGEFSWTAKRDPRKAAAEPKQESKPNK